MDVSVALPVAVIVLAGLVVAAVLLLFFDPSANDGAASIIGAGGVPLAVSALTIQMVFPAVQAKTRLRRSFLWWTLGVLPVGILALSVPGILRDPEYFEGVVGGLGATLFLVVIGLLLGAVAWFFVVLPVALLVTAVGRVLRGERPAAAWFLVPLGALALDVAIMLSATAVDPVGVRGRAGGVRTVLAILGATDGVRVESEPALWSARAFWLIALGCFAGAWWTARRAARTTVASEAE
ncbi:hypothetical protein ASF96_15180 [Microbacterium sp. Leaf179]|nr:hypothetical protein ASF96_15180 [Microbacterium sp. Leaf179]